MSQFHKAEIEKSYGRDNKKALVRDFIGLRFIQTLLNRLNYQQIQRGSEYILS